MSLIAKYSLNKDTSGIGPVFPSLKSSMSFDNSGKIGKCLKINSDHTDFFNIPELENKKIISIALWVKVDSVLSSDWNDIISFKDAATGWNHTGICRIELYSNSTRMSLYSDAMNKNSIGDARPGAYGTFFTEVQQNIWYHIVFTINAITGYTKTYVNGELKDSTNINNNWYCTGKNFQLGQAHILSYNDLEFYDNELSQKEIQLLSQACILNYDFNDPYIEPTVNLDPERDSLKNGYLSNFSCSSGVSVTKEIVTLLGKKCFKIHIECPDATGWKGVYFHATPKSFNAIAGKTYNRSCMLYVPSGQTYPSHFTESIEGNSTNKIYKQYDRSKDGTWQKVFLQGTVSEDLGGNFLHYIVAASSGSFNFTFYICDFQLEENDHSTPFSNQNYRNTGVINDSSGFNNNGIIDGNFKISEDSSIGKYSLKSNGCLITSKQIFFDNINQCHTVSFWVKPTEMINNSFLVNFNAGYSIYHSSTKQSLCYLNGGANDSYVYGPTIPLNEWTMVTWLVDTKNVINKVYYNGIFKAKSSNFTSEDIPYGFATTTEFLKNFKGYIGEIKIFASILSDSEIKDLYESKAYITNNQKIITNQLEEIDNNYLIYATYLSNTSGDFHSSLDYHSTYDTFVPNNEGMFGTYTQRYTNAERTNDGIRIYSPPNIKYSEVGTKMYGGVCLQPLNYDKNILQKGHTYIVTWHIKGQSTRAPAGLGWSNNYGWSDGGLTPQPSNQDASYPGPNFNGEQDCYYKFTIDDDIWKKCTKSYSNAFQKDEIYVSYKCCILINYSYEDTGPLGTDVYITNVQMFDITNLINKEPEIKINGILSAIGFNELKTNSLSNNLKKMKIKTFDDGTKWARIFWHNNDSGKQIFANNAEAADCTTDYKYSRLYLLNDSQFKGTDTNKYEFILDYPWNCNFENESQNKKYNRWRQSANPLSIGQADAQNNSNTGYEAIHIDYSASYLGALCKCSGPSYLTCQNDPVGNWWFCIGATSNFGSSPNIGVPSPTTVTQSVTELWIRIDNTPFYQNIQNQDANIYKSGLVSSNEFIEN